MKAKSAMLLAVLAMLLFSQPASGSSAFTVTLSNGNVIEANSYVITDGRVYLKYPTGEASFPVRQVTSIRSADGGVELLQSEGAFVPRTEPAKAVDNVPSADKPALIHGRGDLNPRKPAARQRPARRGSEGGTPSESSSATAPPRQADPRVDELSRLLDSADADDEARQREIDRKMDAIFDDRAAPAVDFSNVKGRKNRGSGE